MALRKRNGNTQFELKLSLWIYDLKNVYFSLALFIEKALEARDTPKHPNFGFWLHFLLKGIKASGSGSWKVQWI